jgi:3D (Asp-Asp-Asp) domain-containing protein
MSIGRHTLTMAMCASLATTVDVAAQRRRQSQPVLKVSVTAYCVKGQTDAGTPTRPGIVAADPRVLPLGTVVRIDGLRGGYNGTYTVTDTGRAVKGNDVDIFVPNCDAAKRFGRQTGRVRVLSRKPLNGQQ